MAMSESKPAGYVVTTDPPRFDGRTGAVQIPPDWSARANNPGHDFERMYQTCNDYSRSKNSGRVFPRNGGPARSNFGSFGRGYNK